jgi:recombinational DNA repair protein (RecF pathway)
VARVNIEAAKELMLASNLKPLEEYPGGHKPWKCECLICHRIVSPHYSSVQQGRKGCKYCAGRKVDPQEAKELLLSRELKPLEDFPGSKQKWKSECLRCGDVVYPVYGNILAGSGGCKKCAGLLVDKYDAALLLESKGLKPLIEYPGSHSPWLSLCTKCGNQVSPNYSDIRSGKSSGCAFCAGNAVNPDTATKFMKDKGFIPRVPFPGSTKKWPGRCSVCKNEVQPIYSTVKFGQGFCKYCARTAMSERDALELLRKANLTPLETYSKAGNKILCRCEKCKRNVEARLFGIVQGEGGCAYCAGSKVDPVEAKSVMLANGFQTLVDFPGTKKGWKSKCVTCGKTSTPSYGNVSGLGSGCIYCNRDNGAFDGTTSGVFYLITHSLLGAHKIGITSKERKSDRLKVHQTAGWEIYKTIEFAIGSDAFELERKILDWFIKDRNLGPYLSREDMLQGGWTETVDASEIDLPSIWAKVEELSKVKE